MTSQAARDARIVISPAEAQKLYVERNATRPNNLQITALDVRVTTNGNGPQAYQEKLNTLNERASLIRHLPDDVNMRVSTIPVIVHINGTIYKESGDKLKDERIPAYQ